MQDRDQVNSLASRCACEHAKESLEQLAKKFGKVISPDRPVMSSSCFLVFVWDGKAVELGNKLTIAFH